MFSQRFWLRDWVRHAYLMSDGSRSHDHTWLIWVHILFGRIMGRINAIWGTNCPKLLCFGHLLVLELIIKGWGGLNLANSKEMFIGIVNLRNFDQLLNSSYWQFVVHGQGAIEQMSVSVLLKSGQRNWWEVGLSHSKPKRSVFANFNF